MTGIAALEPSTDVARFSVVLPVVATTVAERKTAEDRDAMMHLLAVELVMDKAARVKQFGREHMVLGLGLLQAEDVGLFLVEQPFDDLRAGTDRIDVPGSDLECGHERGMACYGNRTEGLLAACPRQATKRPLLRGHGARADQAFVTQGDRRGPG